MPSASDIFLLGSSKYLKMSLICGYYCHYVCNKFYLKYVYNILSKILEFETAVNFFPYNMKRIAFE